MMLNAPSISNPGAAVAARPTARLTTSATMRRPDRNAGQTRLEHLIFARYWLCWYFGEIQVDVALRLGRPRRFRADLGGAGGGGRAWRARGGKATWARRKRLVIEGAASVRSSQSAPRWRMRTWARRSRARRRSFRSGARPASRARSSRCFCIESGRKEQKTCPRMAASEEWKIGRRLQHLCSQPSRRRTGHGLGEPVLDQQAAAQGQRGEERGGATGRAQVSRVQHLE